MSLAAKLLSASGGGVDKIFSDDVFSSFVYTGNGSTQTINNGIDLAGKGGMVWIKGRNNPSGHHISDTVRGGLKSIGSERTDAQAANGLSSFTPNGFAVSWNDSSINSTGAMFVSWTFRKAPKFFDVVTYTGNGANRTISHALGQEVGTILIKRTDTAADWQVYHRSIANTEYMVLNTTAAKTTGATRWNSTTPTASVFSLGTDTTVNANTGTYVAYLFAHDPSADGIVQCGSVAHGASGGIVNLGWEPQYVLIKQSDATGNWHVLDSMRGVSTGGNDQPLFPNVSAAESDAGDGFDFTSQGFATKTTYWGTSARTFIYLAIRRPNKPPTTGTQVYNAIARTGTGAAATVTGVGFAPDLSFTQGRTQSSGNTAYDRLRGATLSLQYASTSAEAARSNALTAFGMDGVILGSDSSSSQINESTFTYINHFFKRAPGVFDVVCYAGTGVAKTEAHGLGVVPELMIVKNRGVYSWTVWHKNIATPKTLELNSNSQADLFGDSFGSSIPTTTLINFSDGGRAVNGSTEKYVAYLFATKTGISKVGSYTGNGTSQTIDCGFTTGARFVMVKATSTTGNWTVIDTTRGLVAGSDPYLALNSTAAEVTGEDCVDPVSSGFIVNTTTAALNTNGVSYIYLAYS